MTSLRPFKFIAFNPATAPLLDKPIRDELNGKVTTVVENIARLDVSALKGIGGVRRSQLRSVGVKTVGDLAGTHIYTSQAIANVRHGLLAAIHS